MRRELDVVDSQEGRGLREVSWRSCGLVRGMAVTSEGGGGVGRPGRSLET